MKCSLIELQIRQKQLSAELNIELFSVKCHTSVFQGNTSRHLRGSRIEWTFDRWRHTAAKCVQHSAIFYSGPQGPPWSANVFHQPNGF